MTKLFTSPSSFFVCPGVTMEGVEVEESSSSCCSSSCSCRSHADALLVWGVLWLAGFFSYLLS